MIHLDNLLSGYKKWREIRKGFWMKPKSTSPLFPGEWLRFDPRILHEAEDIEILRDQGQSNDFLFEDYAR